MRSITPFLNFLNIDKYRIFSQIGDEQAQKKICQLRRFQDGTIKETVNIQVSTFGGYANDFVLDKIVHLISVHYSEIDIKVCRGMSCNGKSFVARNRSNNSLKFLTI